MRMSCLTLPLMLACATCGAADGALDGTFGNYLPGVSIVPFNTGSLNDRASAVLVQRDGGLVLVGVAGMSSGERIAITRLTPSGAIDTTFGSAGLVRYAPTLSSASANGAALQGDGKIVTVGAVKDLIAETVAFLVCRFGTSGALDGQFGNGGCTKVSFALGGPEKGEAIAIDKEGKIVVGGYASTGTGADFAFARLNANGTPDSSFGFGGTGRQVVTRFDTVAAATTDDFVTSLVIQADGKIIGVGASAVAPYTNYDFAVARLDASGQLDPGYANGGVRTIAFDVGGDKRDVPWAAALQRDGKLVAGGYVTLSATDIDYAAIRLDTNGNPDPGFGSSGKSRTGFDLNGLGSDQARGLAVQSDGNILLAGYSNNSLSGGLYGTDITICRLLSNGWLDSSFGTGGRVAIGLDLYSNNWDHAYALALQGGRPVLAGNVQFPPSGNFAFVALRLTNGLIFTSDFDQ